MSSTLSNMAIPDLKETSCFLTCERLNTNRPQRYFVRFGSNDRNKLNIAINNSMAFLVSQCKYESYVCI